MDATHFDRLTRSLTGATSRRGFVRGFTTAMLGLVAIRIPDEAEAKKKRKKLKRNAFGCVDVGGKCRGNDANCCSGICQGKKPKKGKKDKSHCVPHDAAGCTGGEAAIFCGGDTDVACTTSSGLDGLCLTTTGNGGYCAVDSSCRSCVRDTDCQAEFGPQAACVICTACGGDGRACAVLSPRE